jgi:hypothetical protein
MKSLTRKKASNVEKKSKRLSSLWGWEVVEQTLVRVETSFYRVLTREAYHESRVVCAYINNTDMNYSATVPD